MKLEPTFEFGNMFRFLAGEFACPLAHFGIARGRGEFTVEVEASALGI